MMTNYIGDSWKQDLEQKIMERYLDGQPIKEIRKSLVITTTEVETRVKRVIRKWKKTVRSNTA